MQSYFYCNFKSPVFNLNLFIKLTVIFNQNFLYFFFYRKYKKNLYITYTDGRYGYEAYAQLNNTHLVINDLTLQIKIENEQIISKLIEQELMDCLMSLNKLTDTKTTPRLLEETNFNNNNNNNNNNNPTINEVKVGDLLGDFSFDNEKENSHYFMNVPTKIHSNVSITDSLHSINTNRLVDFTTDDTSSRHHHYHNPLNNKCLSNSNLTMFDQQENHDLIGIIQPVNNHPKSAHSAANLLDSMLDDIPNQTTNSLIAPPPPRPPPPPSTTTSFFNETTLIKSNSFGFDDDFSSFTNLNQKTTTNKPQTPPPLPPFPSTANSNNNNNKTTFSLFDDDPFEQTNTKSMQQQQPTIIPTRPPPLPPMMQMPSIQNKPSSSSSIPPPLPPLPTTATSKTNLQGQINTNINNFNNILQSSDLNLSNRLNSNNNNNNNNIQKLVEFDAFGDSDFSKLNINAINNKPLPPPRPNHFK